MKSHHSIDMTSGSVVRKMFLYAYPIMLRSIINTLYSTVDKVVAGKCIGSAAMAAVGASSLPSSLIVTLVSGLSVGVSVCCSNYIGGKKERELRECIHTVAPLGLISGIFVCVLGILVASPMLQIMNTPASIFDDAKEYMIIHFLCYPISLFNSFTSSMMSATGDTKRPSIISFISGFVNVVFDVLFVLGFKMDVAGLAWATFMSHLTDTILIVWILFSPKDDYKMKFEEIKMHFTHFRRIFAVGMPTGLSAMAYTLSGMLLQSSLNSFGEVVIAANTAGGSCTGYVHLVLMSISSACMCATAQCYGAHKFDRIKKIVNKSNLASVGLMLIVSAIVTAFLRPLLSIFTNEAEVVEAGIPVVMIHCWGFLIAAFGEIYGAALKGMRKSTTSMVINLISVCIPRIIWVWWVLPLMNTPVVLYCVYPVSWLIGSVLMGIAYAYYYRQLSIKATA